AALGTAALAGALAFVLACGGARPAAASPCCASQACIDTTPAACASMGGIDGFCVVGQACGAAACDTALIQPVQGVRAVKSPAGAPADVDLRWTPDANADRYNAWFVIAK